MYTDPAERAAGWLQEQAFSAVEPVGERLLASLQALRGKGFPSEVHSLVKSIEGATEGLLSREEEVALYRALSAKGIIESPSTLKRFAQVVHRAATAVITSPATFPFLE